jgi:hypothetical protein
MLRSRDATCGGPNGPAERWRESHSTAVTQRNRDAVAGGGAGGSRQSIAMS